MSALSKLRPIWDWFCVFLYALPLLLWFAFFIVAFVFVATRGHCVDERRWTIGTEGNGIKGTYCARWSHD